MIQFLAEKNYTLRILSQDDISTLNKHKNITFFDNIKKVVSDVETVLTPMSSTDEQGFLESTFINQKIKLDNDFFELLNKNTLFITGITRPKVKKILDKKKIKYIELARLKNVAILNAIPTAEGAIQTAIEETNFTLFNSNILILGLGKVGLTLAWRLKALGANVFAATRDKSAIARGKDLGLKMISYNNLESYLKKIDIIFNTVPAMILTKKRISRLKKDVLIIDLASDPGGTDFKAARKKGVKALLSLGIPGKTAPKTAAKILADVIPDLISKNR